MRKYLVSGYITYHAPGHWAPIRGAALLTEEEVMDPATVAAVEGILLKEHNSGNNTVARGVTITHFQPYETQAPTGVAEQDMQLNECGTSLPPVDSPVLIEIAPGVILRALRPAFAQNRGDQLVFNLQSGGQYVGRPRWTHP